MNVFAAIHSSGGETSILGVYATEDEALEACRRYGASYIEGPLEVGKMPPIPEGGYPFCANWMPRLTPGPHGVIKPYSVEVACTDPEYVTHNGFKNKDRGFVQLFCRAADVESAAKKMSDYVVKHLVTRESFESSGFVSYERPQMRDL